VPKVPREGPPIGGGTSPFIRIRRLFRCSAARSFVHDFRSRVQVARILFTCCDAPQRILGGVIVRASLGHLERLQAPHRALRFIHGILGCIISALCAPPSAAVESEARDCRRGSLWAKWLVITEFCLPTAIFGVQPPASGIQADRPHRVPHGAQAIDFTIRVKGSTSWGSPPYRERRSSRGGFHTVSEKIRSFKRALLIFCPFSA
jgi:hypothetical protein